MLKIKFFVIFCKKTAKLFGALTFLDYLCAANHESFPLGLRGLQLGRYALDG